MLNLRVSVSCLSLEAAAAREKKKSFWEVGHHPSLFFSLSLSFQSGISLFLSPSISLSLYSFYTLPAGNAACYSPGDARFLPSGSRSSCGGGGWDGWMDGFGRRLLYVCVCLAAETIFANLDLFVMISCESGSDARRPEQIWSNVQEGSGAQTASDPRTTNDNAERSRWRKQFVAA